MSFHAAPRHLVLSLLAAFGIAGVASLAAAQHAGHPMPGMSGHMTGTMHMPGGSAAGGDTREFVKMPAPMVEHTLANMRDHLQALQEIQALLAHNDFTAAAKLAESRLGMSSMGLHGAHEVAGYMPQGMQDAGSAMHRAASRFAITATDAQVSGNMQGVLAGLSEITAQCVGCHAGYRIR